MKSFIVLHQLGLTQVPLASFDDEPAAMLYAGWLDRCKRNCGTYRVQSVDRNPLTPAMRAARADPGHVLAVGAPCVARVTDFVVTEIKVSCRCGATDAEGCRTETFHQLNITGTLNQKIR